MKYFWDDIVGHKHAISQIENDIINHNLTHAYLLAGPPEVGKYAVAKKFANILICPNEYCRSCNDCQQFKSNLHPDVITVNKLWIEKINEDLDIISASSNFNQIHRAKKKVKTDTISIDDIRAVTQKIFEKKQNKYKICLIKNIERLKEAGTNAFLKILEEPPVGTIFILTSSYPEKLSSTLISRIRKITFTNVADNLILEKLQSQSDSNNLEEIISIAQGRPPIAVKLLNDFALFETEKNRFHQIATILSSSKINSHFRQIEKLADNQQEIILFLNAFTRFLRSLILEKNKNAKSGLASELSYFSLVNIVQAVQEAEKQLKQNINKRLLLENFVLKMGEIKDLDGLKM